MLHAVIDHFSYIHKEKANDMQVISERSLLFKKWIFSFAKTRLFILCISVVTIAGLVLNEFIQHFEPAHFSLDDLRRQVKRSKRSVSATSSSQLSDLTTSHQTKAERSRSRYQPPINFNLTAHNRIFQVEIFPHYLKVRNFFILKSSANMFKLHVQMCVLVLFT